MPDNRGSVPPPPTYCKCGHIRIKHPGGLGCNDKDCMGCPEFKAAKVQPVHTPRGRRNADD